MRIVFAALIALTAGSAAAQPDPYRWCSVYGGGEDGGSSNCYFLTLEQCRANVSGIGGYCSPNLFYTGRAAPNEEPPRRKRRHH